MAKELNKTSYFSMGNDTYKVPMELFAVNRQRLCQRLRNLPKLPKNAFVFLEGGTNVPFYDTDIDYNVFRQESFFLWAFGVEIADCIGLINVQTDETYLFVPRQPDAYIIWSGAAPDLQFYSNKYSIKNVHYCDQLEDVLKTLGSINLLIMNGKNSDSGLETPTIRWEKLSKYSVNDTILYNEIADCRVIKTDMEIDVMRYVSKISSEAHKHVMRSMHGGMMEYEAEALFRCYCFKNGGCRHVSYTCICGSGANGAVLHYGHEAAPNNKQINDGELCLFDMGGNYCGYASDITCTFPVNGRFTSDQKLIYNAVLAANRAVINTMKPGQCWIAMHHLANKILLEHLINIGILNGDVEIMLKLQVAAFFQPHGLGHLIGLDVHDVGGYLSDHPSRPTERCRQFLRTARTLQAGMILTVEPGCYFIDVLLDELVSNVDLSKFVNKEILQRFRGFGGVRIEDVVLVTNNGSEILSDVPRTIDEIEDFMKSKN